MLEPDRHATAVPYRDPPRTGKSLLRFFEVIFDKNVVADERAVAEGIRVAVNRNRLLLTKSQGGGVIFYKNAAPIDWRFTRTTCWRGRLVSVVKRSRGICELMAVPGALYVLGLGAIISSLPIGFFLRLALWLGIVILLLP
jgi:hypothetical protein